MYLSNCLKYPPGAILVFHASRSLKRLGRFGSAEGAIPTAFKYRVRSQPNNIYYGLHLPIEAIRGEVQEIQKVD